MIREIINNDMYKVMPFHYFSFWLIASYILFWNRPHVGFDSIIFLLSMIHSGVLGFRLFYHSETDSFLFSLPVSRKKLFVIRYLSGLLFLLLTLVGLFVLMASGLRSLIQSGSPFFPMVKWYELRILGYSGIVCFITYTCSVYLSVYSQIVHNRQLKSVRTGFFYGSIIILIVFYGIIILDSLQTRELGIFKHYLFLIHFLAISTLSVWISAKAYSHLEIES